MECGENLGEKKRWKFGLVSGQNFHLEET